MGAVEMSSATRRLKEPSMSALTMNPALLVSSIFAQVDPVTPSKDFPGADLLANMLQWGMYLSLALSVGSIIYGGGSWTWSKWGNSGYAVSGKSWVLGGIIGALISGLAVTMVNRLFSAAGA
jgi:hypothetical protein